MQTKVGNEIDHLGRASIELNYTGEGESWSDLFFSVFEGVLFVLAMIVLVAAFAALSMWIHGK